MSAAAETKSVHFDDWNLHNKDNAPLLIAKDEELDRSLGGHGEEQCRSGNRWSRALPVTVLLCALVLYGGAILRRHPCAEKALNSDPRHQLSKYAVAAAPALLQDFQVYPPVLTPTNKGLALTNGSASVAPASVAGQSSGCVHTQTLMDYVFANSYGAPFVGTYNPPTNCKFNRITFEITVKSAGRQFDRLGVVYFGDIEIWRTSTAEPTQTGIVWTYIKDMSEYLSLFEQEQKLIFDLGNLVNDIYTASYNATLTATFFNSQDTVVPADVILPVSARLSSSNMPSAYQYPAQDPINNLTLPRNTRKAIFTISATGQIDEEFWFGNVLESDVNTFGPGELLGYSPFREVQLYIDGLLAGVVWPFPIIFTGGVVPGLWRPLVGIDTFDLREDEIDITPWLPMLCDGDNHSFEIKVAGIADNGKGKGQISNTIGSYWVITGKVFLWLDAKGSITTGSGFTRSVPEPGIQLTSHIGMLSNGTNKTLTYSVDVQRELTISSKVKTSAGSKKTQWSQRLTYSNEGNFTDFGNVQVTNQHTEGLDLASTGYARKISYPVVVNTSYAVNPNGSFTIGATINRTQDIYIAGQPVFPTGQQSFGALPRGSNVRDFEGSHLFTTQNGSAEYFATGDNSYSRSTGSTQQDLAFTAFQVGTVAGQGFPSAQGSRELYTRHVLAVNGSVTEDQETLIGEPISNYERAPQSDSATDEYAGGSIRKMLGRGPGSNQV